MADYLKQVVLKMRLFKTAMTDEELFKAPGFFSWLNTFVTAAIAGISRRAVRVEGSYDTNETSFVACTDNRSVKVNTGHPLFSEVKDRKTRLLAVIGAVIHEAGHILFTNFVQLRMFMQALTNGTWYPKTPTGKDAEEMTKALKGNRTVRAIVAQVGQSVSNIIEDAYIELRLCMLFSGTFIRGLDTLNTIRYDGSPSLEASAEKVVAEEADLICVIQNSILDVAKFGAVKVDDSDVSNEAKTVIQRVIEFLDEVNPIIKEAIVASKPEDRYDASNRILVAMWPFIKELLEDSVDGDSGGDGEPQEGDGDGDSESCGDGSGKSSGQKGKSPGKSSEGGSDGSDDEQNGAGDEKGSGESSDAGDGKAAQEGSEMGTGGAGKTLAEMSEEELRGILAALQEIAERHGAGELPEGSGLPVGGKGGVSASDLKEVAEKRAEAAKEAGSGDEKAPENAMIESLIDEIARTMAEQEIEREHATKLNMDVNDIVFGDAHKGIKPLIVRAQYSEDAKAKYLSEFSDEMHAVSKRTQRTVLAVFKDRNLEGKITNLPMGRKFDMKTFPHDDGRYFCRTLVPTGDPNLCVALVVDESGSMGVHKASIARKTAMVLEDILTGIGVKPLVFGHVSHYGKPVFTIYSDTDNVDNKDKYRLANIHSGGSNRDGIAIQYACERLVKLPQRQKLVIVISDGQPSDDGTNYYGLAAIEDCRNIVDKYSKRGVHVFGAAIDQDKDDIKKIYGDRMLDITDLGELPGILSGVVKRYLLR